MITVVVSLGKLSTRIDGLVFVQAVDGGLALSVVVIAMFFVVVDGTRVLSVTGSRLSNIASALAATNSQLRIPFYCALIRASSTTFSFTSIPTQTSKCADKLRQNRPEPQ